MAFNGFDHDIFIFLYGNRRSSRIHCGSDEFDEGFEQIRQLINRLKTQLKFKVKINKSGCLGRCEFGPNLVIFTDNIWYKFASVYDLEEIVMSHIVNGVAVERLIQRHSIV